jgi:hypothetical protein
LKEEGIERGRVKIKWGRNGVKSKDEGFGKIKGKI